MVRKISKTEAKKLIEIFFKDLKGKTPREIKKIKKLAMRYSLKLQEKRKLFCKKCYSIFDSKNSEIRIKYGKKIIQCRECGNVSRWKI